MKIRRWRRRIDRHERRVEELVQFVVVRRLIAPFVGEERMQVEVELVSRRTVRRLMIAVHRCLLVHHRRWWWRRRRHAVEAALAIVEVRVHVIVVIVVRRVVLTIVERSGGALFASISEK